ncbi:MAG: efflux RND transporter permease subunit [Spirochaetia bacterium]
MPLPERKTTASALILCISIAAGFAATASLTQSYYPSPPRPVLTVVTEYRQASAEEIDRRISSPVERKGSTLSGAVSTYSVSTQGKSSVYIVFDLKTSGDTAALRLRKAISEILQELPSAIAGPSVYEGGEESLPVWAAAFPEERREEAERFAEEAEMISSKLRVEGPPKIKRSYQIRLDTLTAAGAGITHSSLLSNFSTSLQQNRWESPKGSIRYSRDGFGRLLMGGSSNSSIPIEETTGVFLTGREKTSIERINGTPSLFVSVYNEGGEQTVYLCSLLEKLRKKHTCGRTVLNRGRSIGDILEEILVSVGIGVLLVCILLSRNIRVSSTFPLFITLPLALFGAAGALKATGASLNMMTLSGAAVSIGLCVDTSVLAFEFTRIHGFSAFKKHVSSPILLSTLTTAAVFFPLPFFPPEVRVQFAGFAGVIVPALAISTVYTLYGLPNLLKGSDTLSLRTYYRHRAVRKVLRRTLPFRRFFAPSILLLLLLTSFAVFLLGFLSFSPYPDVPNPSLQLRYEFPQGTVLNAVDTALRPVEEHLNPLAKEVRVSASREQGTITVTPEDSFLKKDILKAVESRFKSIQFGGTLFAAPEESRAASIPLYFFAPTFPSASDRALEGVRDIVATLPSSRVSLHFKNPMPLYRINTYPFGGYSPPTPPLSSAAELFWAVSDTPFEKAIFSDREYDLKMKPTLHGSFPLSLRVLSSSLGSGAGASAALLNNFLSIEKSSSHGTFYRRNSVPSAGITVHTHTLSREEGGAVLQELFPDALIDPDYESEKFLKRNILLFILTALLFITILLYGYFGCFLSTVATLMQIPLSYILPVYILSILELDLSIPTLAGFLLLAGVSVNNGIILFGSCGEKEEQGAVLRLADKERPLMLSALTTAAGVLPTALTGISSGGVLSPLSLVIASGTIGSYMLLFVQTGLLSGYHDRFSRIKRLSETNRTPRRPTGG